MGVNKKLLGPNAGEEEAFAIEALVFSVQIALQKAMNKRGATNKDLAERLGMTPARVSQIFSSKGANLTLRTIARVAHALGEEFELIEKYDRSFASASREQLTASLFSISAERLEVWQETQIANDNQIARRQLRPAALRKRRIAA